VFAPHAFDPPRLHQCPICQWAVDEDHAEALTMQAASPEPPHHEAEPAQDQYEYVPLAVAGFTLL
jgi:hypothetical protein